MNTKGFIVLPLLLRETNFSFHETWVVIKVKESIILFIPSVEHIWDQAIWESSFIYKNKSLRKISWKIANTPTRRRTQNVTLNHTFTSLSPAGHEDEAKSDFKVVDSSFLREVEEAKREGAG